MNTQPTNFISSGAYSKDVHRNLRSGFIYGRAIQTREFIYIASGFARAGGALDRLKKILFYGKDAEANQVEAEESRNRLLGDSLATAGMPVDLFHGMLGLMTETAEIAEAAINAIGVEQPIDQVNLREEIGDCLWYLSVMAKALGTTLEECAEINTAKLRKRFPDNFTEDSALNRDLTAERAILEGDVPGYDTRDAEALPVDALMTGVVRS